MRKKNKSPAMPVDAARYLADTGHLSTLEMGAYWRLNLHYWQNKGLPADERVLRRLAGLTAEEWAQLRDTLYGLFKLGDWKHKRIESDLTENARLSAAGRTGGRASGVVRREKSKQKQEDRTIVQRSANDQSTKREALKKVSKEERTLDPRGSNGADAPPTAPVYTDSKHELWGEGRPILVSLGLSEQQAGAMIGQWLKATKDDAQAVLGAIQRARDNRVHGPIPWITRALKSPQNGFGHAKARHTSGFHSNLIDYATQQIDGLSPDTGAGQAPGDF